VHLGRHIGHRQRVVDHCFVATHGKLLYLSVDLGETGFWTGISGT
jgi:hypothetical protein